MVFLAIFGIRDSLRDGVKDAVKKCKIASVKITMVTGDDIITSTALAKECGILDAEIGSNEGEIEKTPEKMKNSNRIKKDEYINKLISDMPYALTGNSFYNIIGGIICQVCKKETEICKCPKTEAEAQAIAQLNNTEPKKIKNDKIKDLNNFSKIIKNLRVLARSQPMHKYALVLGLKSLNKVVGVTGDGTNDAPALSKSDVGFAMFSGTDIAKAASDIIIMDNNFCSIVTAIIYGRNIYDNIRKFLQFQLSTNCWACILVFICASIGAKSPLSSIQMLWINLIMDSLGSLALATEPPYDDLLKRPPTKKNEFIINGKMAKHILLQSIVQIILLVILYQYAPNFIKEDNLVRLAENRIIEHCYENYPGKNPEYIINGMRSKWTSDIKFKQDKNATFCGKYKDSLDYAFDIYFESNSGTTHMAIIYNIFVFYILFNQLNCRIIDDSLNIFKRIHKSIFFVIIIVIETILQIIIIFFGGISFQIVDKGLSSKQWGICIGFSAITFVVSIIGKYVFIDVLLDKCLSPEEEEPEFDPVAPEILEVLDDKIRDKESNKTETLNEIEENMISEEFKIKLGDFDYDFNKKDRILNVQEKTDGNNLINTNNETERNKVTTNEEKEESIKNNENENNIDNEIIPTKKEEPSYKKYRIVNSGRNLLNLEENYSTDDENEFKFISLINEPNDNYETVVDSKTIKVYSKMVSHIL